MRLKIGDQVFLASGLPSNLPMLAILLAKFQVHFLRLRAAVSTLYFDTRPQCRWQPSSSRLCDGWQNYWERAIRTGAGSICERMNEINRKPNIPRLFKSKKANAEKATAMHHEATEPFYRLQDVRLMQGRCLYYSSQPTRMAVALRTQLQSSVNQLKSPPYYKPYRYKLLHKRRHKRKTRESLQFCLNIP